MPEQAKLSLNREVTWDAEHGISGSARVPEDLLVIRESRLMSEVRVPRLAFAALVQLLLSEIPEKLRRSVIAGVPREGHELYEMDPSRILRGKCANDRIPNRHERAAWWACTPTKKGRMKRPLCAVCADKFAEIHKIRRRKKSMIELSPEGTTCAD